MLKFRLYLGIMLALGLSFPFSANAGIMTWDFTVQLDNIYRDDANVINDAYQPGTQLSGSFSYDNGLVDQYPNSDYVDSYPAPGASFTLNGLGVHSWEVEVSVVHQSTRDIVDITAVYRAGDIWEEMELGFLDYSQSYGDGELPVDWHMPPVSLADIDFDYTYDQGTDPCCYDSWVSGYVTSLQLRTPQTVPEPGTLAIFVLGLGALSARKIARGKNKKRL